MAIVVTDCKVNTKLMQVHIKFLEQLHTKVYILPGHARKIFEFVMSLSNLTYTNYCTKPKGMRNLVVYRHW